MPAPSPMPLAMPRPAARNGIHHLYARAARSILPWRKPQWYYAPWSCTPCCVSANSPSLAQLLAQDPDSTLRPDAVRSRKFGLEFFRDATGKLRPVDVTMQVIAPSFRSP